MMYWGEAFSNRNFKIEFAVTIILFAIVLTSLTNFLVFIETRQGIVLNDPVLNLFDPVNLTWLTFVLIYFSLFSAIIFFLKYPVLLLKAIQAYTLVIIFRITAMYLVPLNPPEKMIPLNDPFVEFFGTGQLLTKDLFFSGHTATLFLLYLLTDLKLLKNFFLTATILVAVCVMLQHVHYSIDVFAAPFFTYCSIKLVEKLKSVFSASVI
jgi:hypothetical protein